MHDDDRHPAARWVGNRHVAQVFDTLRTETPDRKIEGAGSLPVDLSDEQVAVLHANLRRLPVGSRIPAVPWQSAAILRDLFRPPFARRQYPPWRKYKKVLGLHPGDDDPSRAEGHCRHYAIAQCLAIDPRAWADPVRAVLYAGITRALHMALNFDGTRSEPMLTEALLDQVDATFQYRIIGPLKGRRVPFPEPYRLDVAVATMQEGHDNLAADLAVVLGTRVAGREMYRIVLFQAKKLNADGHADVGSTDSGEQLDKFLSTGMGWYLFYPAPEKGRNFIVTARAATDVFEDVWRGRRKPRYKGTHGLGGAGTFGWDFPTFVSVAMASQDMSLGRLFPTVEAAAAALSIERDVPLVAGVLVADTTGALALTKLTARLDAGSYRSSPVRSLPVGSDLAPRIDDDPSPS